jgi:Ca2+/Na+ antiporter
MSRLHAHHDAFGSLLVAGAKSLPEVASKVGALKIGNLFGSNLFRVFDKVVWVDLGINR